MNALALQSIQVSRQCRHKSLTFTSFHLGNVTLMKNHTANQLHIIRTLANHTLSSLPCYGKRIWQNRIKRHILLRQTLFQLISLRPKLLVGHLFIFVIQTVNNVNLLTQSFQNLLLWIAKNLTQRFLLCNCHKP